MISSMIPISIWQSSNRAASCEQLTVACTLLSDVRATECSRAERKDLTS